MIDTMTTGLRERVRPERRDQLRRATDNIGRGSYLDRPAIAQSIETARRAVIDAREFADLADNEPFRRALLALSRCADLAGVIPDTH